MLKTIRGATTLTANTPSAIQKGVTELLTSALAANEATGLTPHAMTGVWFTMTPDITAENPARVARTQLGWDTVPMMCALEPTIEGFPPLCVRVLIVLFIGLFMRVQFGDVRFQFNTCGYSHSDASANSQSIKTTVSSMMRTVQQHTGQEIIWSAETVEDSKDLFYRISPKKLGSNITEFDTKVYDFMLGFATTNNRIQSVTVVEPKPFITKAQA
jgi:chorismate mutase